MFKEDNFYKINNIFFYQQKNFILYKLDNVSLLEEFDCLELNKTDALVIWSREYSENYVYKKLENCYYFKVIPEFFLPADIQVFIFRYLFLKHLFFLSSLFLLRIEPFRVAMRRLVLRYFYNQRLHHYFLHDHDQKFLFLIESEKIDDLSLSHSPYFNITDFLYFDYLIL